MLAKPSIPRACWTALVFPLVTNDSTVVVACQKIPIRLSWFPDKPCQMFSTFQTWDGIIICLPSELAVTALLYTVAGKVADSNHIWDGQFAEMVLIERQMAGAPLAPAARPARSPGLLPQPVHPQPGSRPSEELGEDPPKRLEVVRVVLKRGQRCLDQCRDNHVPTHYQRPNHAHPFVSAVGHSCSALRTIPDQIRGPQLPQHPAHAAAVAARASRRAAKARQHSRPVEALRCQAQPGGIDLQAKLVKLRPSGLRVSSQYSGMPAASYS